MEAVQYIIPYKINLPAIWVDIPKHILLQSSLAFSISIVCCLLFIGFYLVRNSRYSYRRRTLTKALSPIIGELVIAETEEELQELVTRTDVSILIKNCMRTQHGRRVLVHELMHMHKSMLGAAAGNLRWLYVQLGLQNDAANRISSPIWYIKASALQELAEMRQEQFITKIYRATNSKNDFIRKEAQIAVVQLSGFAGLRFLNIISYPLTEWQQLSLLEHLSLQKGVQWDHLPKWLSSKNDTVVAFALRLVEKYQLYDFHDTVFYCLEHHSTHVRKQALKTIQEIAQPGTAQLLEHSFLVATYDEQLAILDVIRNIGTHLQIPFLLQQLQQGNAAMKHKVCDAIRQIEPKALDTFNITELLIPTSPAIEKEVAL